MKRLPLVLTLLCASALPAAAQSLDDLNLQIHGYATQGFVYSTNNNWNTTDSSDGSPAWTEAVVNLTANPTPKLRIGVQARYFLLGTYGNEITLDWASADYKFNEYFGVRAGKVKTPSGMLNEVQDIDPSQLWVVLPQSIYPIASRTNNLAHNGGLLYGKVPFGDSSNVEYRIFAGERVVPSTDGIFQADASEGINFPQGISGPILGATLKWNTPIPGLMAGGTYNKYKFTGSVVITALPPGTFTADPVRQYLFFSRYEHNKIMVAAEYSRIVSDYTFVVPYIPASAGAADSRPFYIMASYKMGQKLTAGAYYSSEIDRKIVTSSARFQKDWTLSARYDVNTYLYLKAEQHFMDGTLIGYSPTDNTNLQPRTKMTLLKLGVSF
jgi:hypothetical protein